MPCGDGRCKARIVASTSHSNFKVQVLWFKEFFAGALTGFGVRISLSARYRTVLGSNRIGLCVTGDLWSVRVLEFYVIVLLKGWEW